MSLGSLGRTISGVQRRRELQARGQQWHHGAPTLNSNDGPTMLNPQGDNNMPTPQGPDHNACRGPWGVEQVS